MNCCVSFLLFLALSFPTLAQITYPPTPKVEQTDNYHGVIVDDPYRWLETDTSIDTRKWVDEQQKFTEAYLSDIPFREQLKKRIADYYNYARYSTPFRRGEWYYYYKNEGLQNFSVLYRQKGFTGTPELVLDPNKLSEDGSLQLVDFVPSRNGRYGACVISDAGSDWQMVYIKDLETLQDFKDTVRWLKVSDVAWRGDGFYYSRYPEPEKGKELSSLNQNQQLWYHRVGSDQSKDKLIFSDSAHPFRFYYASTSEDERYVFLSIVDRASKGNSGNALWYLDTQQNDSVFVPIVEEPGDYIYGVVDPVPGNKLLIQTNDDAPNSRIILFDPKNPSRKKWKTVIPEKKEPLELATMAGGKLFVKYLRHASSRIHVYGLNGSFIREVKLPGLGDADVYRGLHDDTLVFYAFRSLNYPTHLYQYQISTGESRLFRKPEMIFNPDDYVTSQKFFTSRDGTRVPMFIVHKKGLAKTGRNPALLYGYGGFNYSIGLSYDASIMPWLELGGVYAVVSLRGGGEYGESWHKAGMLHNKQRVFDDFIAAAEYMINRKYTSPSMLAITGSSNGGLLVGTVVNQRPELFRVAVPEMGVLDMLRFQKFTIGWNWIAEYGSSDNENDFRNLYAYSPLHNIRSNTEYPAIMAITADHDDRVVPSHSFKYVATLQEKVKRGNPVLLKIETNTGHGLTSIIRNIELAADKFSFILYNLGMEWNENLPLKK